VERRRQRAEEEKAQEKNRKDGIELLRDGFIALGTARLGLDPQRALGTPWADPATAYGRVSTRSAPGPVEEPRQELAAPVLLRADDPFAGRTRLVWTAVPGATGYVLQEGFPGFVLATDIYRGDRTEHVVENPLGTGGPAFRVRPTLAPPALGPWYRVKATAPGFLDSPWSSTA
jgi:hypothetical protein